MRHDETNPWNPIFEPKNKDRTPPCHAEDLSKAEQPNEAVYPNRKSELFAKHPKPGAAALGSEAYVGPKLEKLEYRGMEIIDDVAEAISSSFLL